MRILITGGSGFVGGRIASFFGDRQKHKIVIGTRQENFRAEQQYAETRFMNWDSTTNLKNACAGIDLIIHTAGLNAGDSAKSPETAYLVNSIYTARLLEAARTSNVKRFIYLSTAHVYNGTMSGEITEETPCKNVHPYAASHRAGEDLVQYYTSKFPAQTVILRLSNGFGPPASVYTPCWKLVINDLCRQIFETGRMQIRSSGLQKRDFIPLTSVCETIGFLSDLNSVPGQSTIYNLSSGVSYSLREMANLIQSRCQSLYQMHPALEIMEPDAVAEQKKLEIRNDKLRTLYSEWKPDTQAEIDSLLAFCRKNFA